ncbi:hypothetical protein CTL2C_101 [Chlamydia trachomatis L2c]|nr:hypothetical protein CTL2C_101 [Chlamydia trachomatis L2c]
MYLSEGPLFSFPRKAWKENPLPSDNHLIWIVAILNTH